MFSGLSDAQTEFLIAHPAADELAAFIEFDLTALRAAEPPFRKGSDEDLFLRRLAALVLAAHGGSVDEISLGDFEKRMSASASEHVAAERKKRKKVMALKDEIAVCVDAISKLGMSVKSITGMSDELGISGELPSHAKALRELLDHLRQLDGAADYLLWPGTEPRRKGRPRISDQYHLLVVRTVEIANAFGIPVTASRDPDGRPNCRFSQFINGLTDAFDLDIGFRKLAEMAVLENDPDLII